MGWKLPKLKLKDLLPIAALFVPGLQPYALAAMGISALTNSQEQQQQQQPQTPQVITPVAPEAPVVPQEPAKAPEAPAEPSFAPTKEATVSSPSGLKIGGKSRNPFKRLPTNNLKISEFSLVGSSGTLNSVGGV